MTLLEGTCRSIDDSFMYTDVIMDMLMDVQNMDYLDFDLVMNKGWNDMQRLMQNQPAQESNSKSADDLLFFTTRMKNNDNSLAWVRVLIAFSLLNMYVF